MSYLTCSALSMAGRPRAGLFCTCILRPSLLDIMFALLLKHFVAPEGHCLRWHLQHKIWRRLYRQVMDVWGRQPVDDMTSAGQ